MSTTTTLTDSQRAQLHQLLEQRKAQLLAELGDIQRDTLAAAAGQDGTEAPEDPRDQADRLAHNTVRDAEAILDLLAKRPLIEKKRHLVPRDGFVWEVDEFFGQNAGLIIAEIELASEDQTFPLPPWVGREVTGEARYYNSSLVGKPFSEW